MKSCRDADQRGFGSDLRRRKFTLQVTKSKSPPSHLSTLRPHTTPKIRPPARRLSTSSLTTVSSRCHRPPVLACCPSDPPRTFARAWCSPYLCPTAPSLFSPSALGTPPHSTLCAPLRRSPSTVAPKLRRTLPRGQFRPHCCRRRQHACYVPPPPPPPA